MHYPQITRLFFQQPQLMIFAWEVLLLNGIIHPSISSIVICGRSPPSAETLKLVDYKAAVRDLGRDPFEVSVSLCLSGTSGEFNYLFDVLRFALRPHPFNLAIHKSS